MIIIKKFKIRKGNLYFQEQREFKSVIEIIIWKIVMKKRGFRIEEY